MRRYGRVQNKGPLGNLDVHYHCEYDYHNGGDCESYGCNDEGICRCSTIEDARVTKAPSISWLVTEFAKKVKLKKPHKEIDLYGLDRIFTINMLWDTAIYNVEVEGGYYGEEIRGIFMEDQIAKKTQDEARAYLKLKTNREKVEYLLNAEYGKLLKNVKGRQWRVKTVKCEEIVFGAESYQKKVAGEVDRYKDYNLPRGVCVLNNDKYWVIDGYHRLTGLVHTKATTARIIVGK